MNLRTAAMAACALVAVLDLFQVIFIGKGVVAVGGLVLYSVYARGLQQRSWWAPWAVLFMPLIPLSVIAGLQGEAVRAARMDTGMLVVAAIQIVGSACAGGLLWSERAAPDRTR